MSKSKEILNRQALDELMVVIRRNAQHSACIDNFEKLLYEIDDPIFVNTVVSSMHNLLTEVFELFYAIERVPQKKFKAKMFTTQFIEPMRFFSRVKTLADNSMKIRASIELLEQKYTEITVDTDRNPMRISIEEAENIINKVIYPNYSYIDWNTINRLFNTIDHHDEFIQRLETLKETARKEMLTWNYIPAIIKAVMQTKRRSLNMDTNSKKFK